MASSDNPKISSAAGFKKKSKGQPLTLPSGETALVRPVGMDKLLAANVIPDSLTPMAQAAIKKAESSGATPGKAAEDVITTPEQIAEMFRSFDRITAMCVVQPEVRWHQTEKRDPNGVVSYVDIPDNERDDEIVYTDEIDMDDKMFIFQFVVGGTRDLEAFREQLGQSLASVDGSSAVEDASV